PAAGRRTNTTGCRSGKVDQSTNLCQIRIRIGRNGKLHIDGYLDTSDRVHAKTIGGGDSGSESSAISVSVGRRAARTSSGVTKGPVASRYTNSTGCMCGNANSRANLGWIRTGYNGNSQLRIDGQ